MTNKTPLVVLVPLSRSPVSTQAKTIKSSPAALSELVDTYGCCTVERHETQL
jgi:hypothetical protein